MNYVLIEKTQLDAKGVYPYAEVLPDGRAILPLNALKGLDGVTGISLISGDDLKVLSCDLLSKLYLCPNSNSAIFIIN